jgi:hypothetical protein
MFSAAILYGRSDAYIKSKKIKADWERSFRCLRCGTTFIPEDAHLDLPVLTDVVVTGKTLSIQNNQKSISRRYA